MYDTHESRVKNLLSKNDIVFSWPCCLQTKAWFKGQISLGNPNGNEHCRTKDFPHKYKIQPNLKNTILCVNIDNLHHKMKKFTSNTMYFP